MELKFRHRDYRAEVEIHSFRRMPAQTHPLSLQSPSCDQVQCFSLSLLYQSQAIDYSTVHSLHFKSMENVVMYYFDWAQSLRKIEIQTCNLKQDKYLCSYKLFH